MFKAFSAMFSMYGGLWSRQEILLKITEELGELCQALRKKERPEQEAEYGDLLFAVFALAEREGFSIEDELNKAMAKHIRKVSSLYSPR